MTKFFKGVSYFTEVEMKIKIIWKGKDNTFVEGGENPNLKYLAWGIDQGLIFGCTLSSLDTHKAERIKCKGIDVIGDADKGIVLFEKAE